MAVVLGARTDSTTRVNDVAVGIWCTRFAVLWSDLGCDCRGVAHHEKRIRTIEKRLNDPDLMEAFPVGSEERTDAERALALHRHGLVDREKRINERTWAFSAFWAARPSCVDAWLTDDWFAFGPESDDVLDCMTKRSRDTVWVEVVRLWKKRKPARCAEAVPF